MGEISNSSQADSEILWNHAIEMEDFPLAASLEISIKDTRRESTGRALSVILPIERPYGMHPVIGFNGMTGNPSYEGDDGKTYYDC